MNNTKIELNPHQTVLVIGGKGFIGRHIVRQLENWGCDVLVGTRCQNLRSINERKIEIHLIHHESELDKVLKHVDVVVNAVGILRERKGETYDQVHHLAVETLAIACKKRDIRFIHISALGLDNEVKSQFLNSKKDGERAVQRIKGDWYIVRPSLVDGDGGYGAKWFRRVAKWPIHFAPANANGVITPIHVEDLAECIAKIALKADNAVLETDRIYEIGGEHQVTVLEYLKLLEPNVNAFSFKVPAWFSRLTSHIFDLFKITPFSFGHYELLKFDNKPTKNQTKELIANLNRQLGGHQSNYRPALNQS